MLVFGQTRPDWKCEPSHKRDRRDPHLFSRFADTHRAQRPILAGINIQLALVTKYFTVTLHVRNTQNSDRCGSSPDQGANMNTLASEGG